MIDKEKFNQELWNRLRVHQGHRLVIAVYGDPAEPANISLECKECGEVVLDTELYTICAREDGENHPEATKNIADEIAAEIEILRADAKIAGGTGEADCCAARIDALEWVLGRLIGENTPRSWAHF